MSSEASFDTGGGTGSEPGSTTSDEAAVAPPPEVAARSKKKPLYPRLLRLRHVHPNAWQRAVLGEGAIALAVLLVLADVASAWTLLVLPVAVAVVVKAHDLLAGLLTSAPQPAPDAGAGPRSGPPPMP